MEKGKFQRLGLLAALSGVAVLSMGVVSLVNQTMVANAGTVETKSCNYIYFGTAEYSSNGSVTTDDFTVTGTGLTNVGVSSSSYCYANNGSAARIGKGSTAGTLVFSFSSVKITAIGIDGFLYNGDSSKTAAVTVSTSANTTGFTFNCSSTSSAHFADGNAFAGNSASTTLTISSSAAARFNLTQIRVETSSTTVTPDSSSSSSSSAHSSSSSSSSSSEISSGQSISSTVASSSDISFHFLELGNAKTGDSTFIKAGDNDILIDAGSYYDSYSAISTAINQYCTDGKLEYVICTHAHTDHMAGFTYSGAASTTTSGNGIFYNYKVGTIIDFAQANSTANIYDYYKYARAYAVSQGAVHYTALQCWNNSDGAARTYTLGTNLTMQILYTEFYASASSDENNNSVCVMFNQGSDAHFLFTGDLEAAGETSLISNNTLPKVKLFKGAHHGSYTATSSALTAVIQPEMVAVCCCAGNTQYTSGADHVFPTQDFINNVAPYTKAIYITTLGSFTDTSVHNSFNGQINITYHDGAPTVACSNNNTILPLSDWFNKKGDLYDSSTPNRVWPSGGVPLT
ncbi:MAG: ComEC family competence protein [Tenericutes bacterium ADurb.BinA155]|nr:MAG: ComEC family competence protein [Tenericutes bacterium ADurb.BinA155]